MKFVKKDEPAEDAAEAPVLTKEQLQKQKNLLKE